MRYPLPHFLARAFTVCFLRVTRRRSWDTPFPLVHERFYIPDYLRVFEGIKATMTY